MYIVLVKAAPHKSLSEAFSVHTFHTVNALRSPFTKFSAKTLSTKFVGQIIHLLPYVRLSYTHTRTSVCMVLYTSWFLPYMSNVSY